MSAPQLADELRNKASQKKSTDLGGEEKVYVATGQTVAAGQVFTCGRGSQGQLGQDEVRFPRENCAIPHPVPGLSQVIHVACGGGQQGCTGAVTADGFLYTFGNNYGGRLGHGVFPDAKFIAEPMRVEALAAEGPVTQVAFGSSHGAALTVHGTVYTWGSGRCGCLGRPEAEPKYSPHAVILEAPAIAIDCEHEYSTALCRNQRVCIWGSNQFGKLGLGTKKDRVKSPHEIPGLPPVSCVRLGSVYAAAITTDGHLYVWGWGGHGNLGIGKRVHCQRKPVQVQFSSADNGKEVRIVDVACTRGQVGWKGGAAAAKAGGAEGPHTVAVDSQGFLWTFGTCHKGVLLNLGNKTGAFGDPWDELSPYRVGSGLRNKQSNPPISPFAAWPPPYSKVGPFRSCVSGHIHAAAIGAEGRAWAWGCGSNDGRCGVERFLNMAGEGKPPRVDAMKCYMMCPHRIGEARPLYWKGGESLTSMHVLQISTGRNHMAMIAVEARAD